MNAFFSFLFFFFVFFIVLILLSLESCISTISLSTSNLFSCGNCSSSLVLFPQLVSYYSSSSSSSSFSSLPPSLSPTVCVRGRLLSHRVLLLSSPPSLTLLLHTQHSHSTLQHPFPYPLHSLQLSPLTLTFYHTTLHFPILSLSSHFSSSFSHHHHHHYLLLLLLLLLLFSPHIIICNIAAHFLDRCERGDLSNIMRGLRLCLLRAVGWVQCTGVTSARVVGDGKGVRGGKGRGWREGEGGWVVETQRV